MNNSLGESKGNDWSWTGWPCHYHKSTFELILIQFINKETILERIFVT